MPIDFYYLPGSAPCNSILMVAEAVGVQLNLKKIELQRGEQLTPEFIKINPQHTIPTIDDNGFSLWESRAILVYLVEKYGKDNDSLYPKDAQIRATINQRLYFDMGTFYQRFADYYYPQMNTNAPADPEKYKKIEEAFEFLNTFLEGNAFLAGASVTLADYANVATLFAFSVIGFEFSKYKNVQRWYESCAKTLIGFEKSKFNMDEFRKLFEEKMKK